MYGRQRFEGGPELRGLLRRRRSGAVVRSGAAMEPKRVEAVRVTVPPMEWKTAPLSASASVSQLQATSENIASSTSCSSVSAERYPTQRIVPFHAS